MEKKIVINVYSPSGQFITNWSDFQLSGFDKELNAGPGECVIILLRKFDYAGSDVLENNEIEVSVADMDTAADPSGAGGRIIYRGYISLIEPDADGDRESIVVHALGYYTKLSLDILKSGSQTKLYSYASGLTVTLGSQAPCDIAGLMRATIDRYIAETTNSKIGYNAADIPNLGTTVEYLFEQKTYRDAMDAVMAMAPAGTNYYIDENGRVKLGAQPTTPTHQFVHGKHFRRVSFQRNMESVRNVLLVWNGEPTGAGCVYKHYEDTASIAKYGRRAETVMDTGVGDTAAADAIGARFLALCKDPEVKATVVILDNNGSAGVKGYDIESIRPGDTCEFVGFDVALAGNLKPNMLVTKVSWQVDRAVVEVQVTKSGLADFQRLQGKKIGQYEANGSPETYT